MFNVSNVFVSHRPDCDQLVAALYSDGSWYRAKVNNITTPEKCSVYFVDYGNRAEIPIRDIRLLPVQFVKTPYQAVGLVLAGVQHPPSGWSNEIVDSFKVCWDLFVNIQLVRHRKPITQIS